jgi:hypothetical protein
VPSFGWLGKRAEALLLLLLLMMMAWFGVWL